MVDTRAAPGRGNGNGNGNGIMAETVNSDAAACLGDLPQGLSDLAK